MENIVFNGVWGFEIAVEMTLLAIASFSAVLAFISYLEGRVRDAIIGGLVATALPIASLAILVSHLLKPEAAHLVFMSFQARSWMPWGAAGVTMLLVLSAIFTILTRMGSWKAATIAVGALTSLAGLFVALYTGLVLAYERGIPFWHSAAIPLIALIMGAIGGLSVYSIIRPGDTRIVLSLGIASLVLLVAYLVHIHLSLVGPVASRYSAQAALSTLEFIIGIVTLILTAILSFAALKTRTPYLPVAAATLAIISIFTLRLALLNAGAWELPIL